MKAHKEVVEGSNSKGKEVTDESRSQGSRSVSSLEKARSINRFAILTDSCMEEHGENSNVERELEVEASNAEDIQNVGQRKARAASAGVAKLMRSLKATRKGPYDKGKIKQVRAGSSVLGGQNSIPS